MNEQVERLVRIAVGASASVDVTFEAGGEVRVNIYPRDPAQELTMSLKVDTSEVAKALDAISTEVRAAAPIVTA